MARAIIESMVIDMTKAPVRTLEQVRQVLAGTQVMKFQAAAGDEGRYAWIGAVLERFDYPPPGWRASNAALCWPTSSD